MAAAAADQTLNKRDDQALKQVMKLYESKQMKKALKTVQGILDKNPNHGESLAMKGLIISSAPYNKKEEAYALVKQGISKNFKSLVCWHVYGLLYRADNNYAEAIKCYKQALRIDDTNMSILRDLSMLQVQHRDLATLTDTRQRLLELKPHTKTNWIGFALAHHLQGNYECAQAILEAYESTMGLPSSAYEVSEFFSYRILVCFESKDWQGTLNMIEQYKDRLRDPVFTWSTQGECYENLDNMKMAVRCYTNLVEFNSECKEFLDAYVEARKKHEGISEAAIYKELREQYPKSQTIEKFQGDYCDGEEFKKLARQFIKRYLVKCIPSLGSALKSHYNNEAKVKVLEEILDEFDKEYTESETIDGEPANKVVRFWIWVAYSNHFLRIGQFEKALDYCEKARTHTPTIEMIYAFKARILKKLDRKDEAAQQVEISRNMDLADRYFNNKAVKYLMRCGKWQEAEELYTIFTYTKQHETWATIMEMQCMWYEIELADCFYRKGDIDAALHRYLLVDRHFNDIVDDQIDFHHYLSKKNNVRAYLDMLRFMDHARDHKFFCKAAKQIVRCYLDIHHIGKEEVEKRKLAELAEYVEKRDKLMSKEQKEKETEFDTTIDYDTPLVSAERFLKELLKFRAQELPTQTLAIEFYTVAKFPIKALQNIKQAMTLKGAAASAELKEKVTAFFKAQESIEGTHDLVKQLLADVKAEVMPKFTSA
eukprot:TRINITY_DN58818_c0_g1_i1.p2 TRINITY_DN58818_c0_g1~~TRINITY_DN58818_c0_g1_i1.p2  ORF type:complete len:711 (+),score=402.25 TRINITY_DN58818_c0_g1_i1:251-2383(+)